ncbi:protein E22A [Elephant endotheliotropic herpesvirus 3A]|uniref:Protein E22A n=1 Tax=Elephant endotheliotropic herpesvirus 3A TaxID=1329409 RepID=A0A866VSI2_9BETA|nr:protein E22A [Elephant endotheliotropic herpesvirus 3A]QOE74396.1 protein E22A [Elephant endotheliotropic herpesvirus 3A]
MCIYPPTLVPDYYYENLVARRQRFPSRAESNVVSTCLWILKDNLYTDASAGLVLCGLCMFVYFMRKRKKNPVYYYVYQL